VNETTYVGMMDVDYFPILQLTPDEPIEIIYDYHDSTPYGYYDDTPDDLLELLPLTPDITSTTDGNHLHCEVRLVLEELGVLTEEPEQIDPNRDYEKEFEVKQREVNRRSRQRRNARDASLNSLPSLANSEVTSAASSAEPRRWPQPHDMVFRRPCHMHEITHDMKDNATGPLPGDLIAHPSAYLYEETYR
jgi:hypothetical protein